MEEICMGTLIITINWNFNVLFSFAATLKTDFYVGQQLYILLQMFFFYVHTTTDKLAK